MRSAKTSQISADPTVIYGVRQTFVAYILLY